MTYDFGPWIGTYTGRKVYPGDLKPEDVDIDDIAHSLSLVNRWVGHSRVPFSVAQHSVIVSRMVPKEHALWGLLHDAAEAYMGDLSKPVKQEIPEFRRMEAKILRAVAIRFGLKCSDCHRVSCTNLKPPTDVKEADNRMLVTEARDILGSKPDAWDKRWGVEPFPFTIEPADWQSAEAEFLTRFYELQGAA